MSNLTRTLLFLVSCVFTQNFVFVRLMGGSALLKKAGSVATAAVVGAYTAVVMALSCALNWLVYKMALVPLGAESLYLVAFALVVLCSAWLVGLAIKSVSPKLGEALGENGAALCVNCAVLGASLIGMDGGILRATLTGLFGGLGYLLALVLLAGVQERLEFSRVPESMKGLPIQLVSASLLALAFMGFIGL